MTRSVSPPWLALSLSAALVAGLLVAWSPRYWGVTVAITALSAVSVWWALTALIIRVPAPTVIVLLIAAWGFLQMALHKTEVPSQTLRGSITWLMCGVSFVVASQVLRFHRERRAFLETFLWALTFLAVEAMLQMYLRPVRVFGIIPAEDSVFGTTFYTNQFAALMELAAPVALWLISRGRSLAGGLAFAAIFAATIASASRAGVVLVLSELLVFLAIMLISRRLPAKSAWPFFGLLLAMIGVASMVAGTEKIWNRFQEKNPYSVRESLFESTVKMTRERPVFGFGIGTWRSAYPRFATLDMELLANEAHNDWAEWAAEGGLPFAGLLAVLVICVARPAISSIWGLGILAMALHCWVDYPMREPAIEFVWFAFAGALTQHRRRPPDSGDKSVNSLQ